MKSGARAFSLATASSAAVRKAVSPRRSAAAASPASLYIHVPEGIMPLNSSRAVAWTTPRGVLTPQGAKSGHARKPLVLEMRTESVDPRFVEIDRWPTAFAVEAMLEGQLAAIASLFSQQGQLAAAAEAGAARLLRGGRLVYVGAGTSGR